MPRIICTFKFYKGKTVQFACRTLQWMWLDVEKKDNKNNYTHIGLPMMRASQTEKSGAICVRLKRCGRHVIALIKKSMYGRPDFGTRLWEVDANKNDKKRVEGDDTNSEPLNMHTGRVYTRIELYWPTLWLERFVAHWLPSLVDRIVTLLIVRRSWHFVIWPKNVLYILHWTEKKAKKS